LTSEGAEGILAIEKKRAFFSKGEKMKTKRTTYTKGGIRYRKTTVYEIGENPITYIELLYIVRTKSEAKNI